MNSYIKISDLKSQKVNYNKVVAVDQRKKNKSLFDYNKFLRHNSFKDSRRILMNAVNNVKPIMGVYKTRIRGRNQYIPKIMSKAKQISLALKWFNASCDQRLTESKKKNSKQKTPNALALDIIKAIHKKGYAFQKRNDLYKLVEINRVFIRRK